MDILSGNFDIYVYIDMENSPILTSLVKIDKNPHILSFPEKESTTRSRII